MDLSECAAMIFRKSALDVYVFTGKFGQSCFLGYASIMIKFAVHFCVWLFGGFFIFSDNVWAQDIHCSSIKTCEDKVLSALNTGASLESYGFYFKVSKAFSPFDQAGFDALFKMMKGVAGDQQDILAASLSYMVSDRRNSFDFEMSSAQFETLVQMWGQNSSYDLAKLINHTDTPAAHAFVLTTLKSENKQARYWMQQALTMSGFGNETSEIHVRHLPIILDLIRRQNHAELVPTLNRIDTETASIALWSLLKSDHERVFSKVFEILVKEDEAKLYKAIKAQTFSDAPADRKRALMIAETIRRERFKRKPTETAYQFWAHWYDAAETSDTQSMIPAYQLFELYEESKMAVDSADKFIADRIRWRSLTEANAEGRKGRLSVEYLTKEINDKRRETARMIPLVQLQTSRLTRDEYQVMADYFRIFDAQSLSSEPLSYEYGADDYLLWPIALDAVIQTPEMWGARLWSYIEDAPFVENSGLVKKVTALESDKNVLKLFYLQRLSYADNVPKLLSTLETINQKESLRKDQDIRDAVRAVSQNTPFTMLKVAADFTLSEPDLEQRVADYNVLRRDAPFNKAVAEENAKRTYCAPSSTGKSHYMLFQPDLKLPLAERYNNLGAPIMTIETPSGYLSGHNRGEFGGGLVYYRDIASEGQLLTLSYSRNVIAIVESKTEGVYWVLAGLNHMVPGNGMIYAVDARTDRISVTPHKRIPYVPYETSFLKGGDLFMDFRAKSFRTYNMNNNRAQTVHKVKEKKYNPPVILTRKGELVSACEN